MTQSEIKNEIAKLQLDLIDVCTDEKADKTLLKAKQKVRDLEKKYETKVGNIEEHIWELKKQLKEIRRTKELQLSPYLKEWLRRYGNGIDWGYGGAKIAWASDDERFVIITNRGGIAGTGTAMGTGGYYYAPSDHWIVDTMLCKEYTQKFFKPNSKDNPNGLGYPKIEGKLTKAKKQELFAAMENYKRRNKIK